MNDHRDGGIPDPPPPPLDFPPISVRVDLFLDEGEFILLKRLKFLIYTRPFFWFAYYVIRLYSSTFRLTVRGEKEWRNSLKDGKAVILCTWHQLFFPAIYYFRTYARLNPGLMISQSKDGDLISHVARSIGWHTPRGSSSNGGKAALDAMIDHVRTHGFGAHVLDGPTGPMGVVKAGAIKMALETGAVLAPFYTRADRAWFFNSWDRFMVPKPFAKVEIRYDAPIALETGEGAADFETLRKRLEDHMQEGLFWGDHHPK